MQLPWRTEFTCGLSERNSGVAPVGVEDGRLEELPGIKAKLLWWFAGARGQRGGGFTMTLTGGEGDAELVELLQGSDQGKRGFRGGRG